MRNLYTLGVLCLGLTAIGLQGCASTKLANPTFYEKTPLNLPQPAPVELGKVRYYVITKDNAQQVLQGLEANGHSPVIFGFTEEDFKSLERNLGQIQGTLEEWRTYGEEYKTYYEKKKDGEEN